MYDTVFVSEYLAFFAVISTVKFPERKERSVKDDERSEFAMTFASLLSTYSLPPLINLYSTLPEKLFSNDKETL